MQEIVGKPLERRVTISAGDSKSGTCKECDEHLGEFTLGDESSAVKFPPYHPNCVCEAEITTVEAESSDGPMCYDLKEVGTENEMLDLVSQAKKLFYIFDQRYTSFSPFGIIPKWYFSRIPGVSSFMKKEDSCNKRAEDLLNEFNKYFSPAYWYNFKYSYDLHGILGIFPHAWIELELNYIDKRKKRIIWSLNLIHILKRWNF